MQCDDIQRLLQGRTVLPAEAARHLEGCPACTAMVAAAPHLPRRGPDVGASDRALLSATLAAIDDERGASAWLRAQSTTVRLALALVAALLMPIAIALVWPRADLGGYPRTRLLAELALLVAVWAVAAAIVLRPLQRALTTGMRIAATSLVLVALAVLASLPAHEHAAVASIGGFLPHALACLLFGTLAAIPAWLALRMLARDAGAHGRRAAVLGAAAAAVGVACVFLHCANADPQHLWAGHVTVALPLFAWAWWHARAR